MVQDKYAECIRACNLCADACDHCSVSCLEESNVSHMANCIRLDMDCSALCRLAAGYMARDSDHVATICRACADICEACADECSKHDHDHCQRCAEACRECARLCRQMAA